MKPSPRLAGAAAVACVALGATLPGAPFVFAPEYADVPEVQLFSQGDTSRPGLSFAPFGTAFSGGVRVASGDVNGDGTPDIVAGAGPGGGPHVRVFSGSSQQELLNFFAFDPAFAGGVFVASGDVNGDGHADVIVGAGPGGGPHVKVFDGTDSSNVLQSFFAFDTGYLGGVAVAAGDINGDGRADIVAGTAGGGNQVKAFSGADLAVLNSFFPYESAFQGGVRVASGDLNGDGFEDVVVSPASGRSDIVAVDGRDRAVLLRFFAYAPGFEGGIHVAAGDLNGDGRADIATAPGSAAGEVKVFDGTTGRLAESFVPFPPPYAGGVQVAIGPNTPEMPPFRFEGVFAGFPAINFNPPAGVSPVLADFDLDGEPEIATIVPANGTISIFNTTISDSSSPTPVVRTPGMDTIFAARLDSDGMPDLIACGPAGAIAIRSNNGLYVGGAAIPVPSIRTVADFNGDGFEDIYAFDPEEQSLQLYAYRPANLDFSLTRILQLGYTATSLASGDIRGTGRPDLVVLSASAGQANVYPNNGGGVLAAPKANNIPPPTAGALGDFDRDGRPDLATIHSAQGNLTIHFGDGTGLFPSSQTYAAGTSPASVGAFHADRDGDLDVIVQGADGRTLVFRNRTANDSQPETILRHAYPLRFAGSPGGIAVGVATQPDGSPDIILGDRSASRVSLFQCTTLLPESFFDVFLDAALGGMPATGRGDANGDGAADAADPLAGFLFIGDDAPPPQ